MAISGLNLAISGDFRAKFAGKVVLFATHFWLRVAPKGAFLGAQIGSFGKIFLEALLSLVSLNYEKVISQNDVGSTKCCICIGVIQRQHDLL